MPAAFIIYSSCHLRPSFSGAGTCQTGLSLTMCNARQPASALQQLIIDLNLLCSIQRICRPYLSVRCNTRANSFYKLLVFLAQLESLQAQFFLYKLQLQEGSISARLLRLSAVTFLTDALFHNTVLIIFHCHHLVQAAPLDIAGIDLVQMVHIFITIWKFMQHSY